MTDFMYFFLAVYFFASLIVWAIKSYEKPDFTWPSMRNSIGDFAVRAFYIFVIWWSVSHLVDF